MSNIKISPDNKLAAYSIDTVSRRLYTIKIKNLETGEFLNDCIDNTSGNFAWGNDNTTLFYTNRDSETLRNDKIYKHVLGTTSKDDELVFHDKDNTFYTNISKSKSNKFILIASYNTLTSDSPFLNSHTPHYYFYLFIKLQTAL